MERMAENLTLTTEYKELNLTPEFLAIKKVGFSQVLPYRA